MLLHLFSILLNVLGYLVSCILAAIATFHAIRLFSHTRHAELEVERRAYTARILRLEKELKTWQPFTVDHNAAMSAAILEEIYHNARPLALPEGWATANLQLPSVVSSAPPPNLKAGDLWIATGSLDYRDLIDDRTPRPRTRPKGSDSIYRR